VPAAFVTLDGTYQPDLLVVAQRRLAETTAPGYILDGESCHASSKTDLKRFKSSGGGKPPESLRYRSGAQATGEPACRPGSVHPPKRADGHPSGTAVAGSLVRSTREHRAGRPQALAQEAGASLLTLLQVGFTKPPQSPAALVVSYTTVSPLPRARPKTWPGRSVFCGTVPRVTPGRRYRPPCPAEPGPSSPAHAIHAFMES
jgi:hypothetical protein